MGTRSKNGVVEFGRLEVSALLQTGHIACSSNVEKCGPRFSEERRLLKNSPAHCCCPTLKKFCGGKQRFKAITKGTKSGEDGVP